MRFFANAQKGDCFGQQYNPRFVSSHTGAEVTSVPYQASNPRLVRIQIKIPPFLLNQLIVLTLLGYLSLLYHQYLIGLPDGTQSVRNHKGGSPLEQLFQTVLNQRYLIQGSCPHEPAFAPIIWRGSYFRALPGIKSSPGTYTNQNTFPSSLSTHRACPARLSALVLSPISDRLAGWYSACAQSQRWFSP